MMLSLSEGEEGCAPTGAVDGLYHSRELAEENCCLGGSQVVPFAGFSEFVEEELALHLERAVLDVPARLMGSKGFMTPRAMLASTASLCFSGAGGSPSFVHRWPTVEALLPHGGGSLDVYVDSVTT